MSRKANVQLVEQAYANFKEGNIPGILEALTADVDWFIPGPTELIPFVGRRRGPDQVGEFFAGLAASQSALKFEPREFISQGDKVVVLGHPTVERQIHRADVRRRLGARLYDLPGQNRAISRIPRHSRRSHSPPIMI